MGTNYYLRRAKGSAKTIFCTDETTEIHIGKSSAGWCFSLHVIPELEINNLDDWKSLIKGALRGRWKIVNEYGDIVSYEELMEVIEQRSWEKRKDYRNHPHYSSEAEFLEKNHAVPGPNGLVRHQIGRYCLGHGPGTYDYIPGHFF